MSETAIAGGRPATCKVIFADDLAICHRCGLQWVVEDPQPPACNPMTFARMRDRLLSDITSAETSLAIVAALKEKGDPAPALAKLAELEALLRFYDRATGSKEIRDLINGESKRG